MYAIEKCKDFAEWPNSWSEVEGDLSYSKDLIEIFDKFVVHLDKSGLSRKTILRHMDNLWQLGGELVRRINLEENYSISPNEHLLDHIDAEGGPYCRHLDTEEEMRSYDATCKKLFKYLKQECNRG